MDARRTNNSEVSGITFCTNTCSSSCSPYGPIKSIHTYFKRQLNVLLLYIHSQLFEVCHSCFKPPFNTIFHTILTHISRSHLIFNHIQPSLFRFFLSYNPSMLTFTDGFLYSLGFLSPCNTPKSSQSIPFFCFTLLRLFNKILHHLSTKPNLPPH